MITALLVLLCVSSLEDWEPIRLRRVGECHNMRQGVMGNASIFARE